MQLIHIIPNPGLDFPTLRRIAIFRLLPMRKDAYCRNYLKSLIRDCRALES